MNIQKLFIIAAHLKGWKLDQRDLESPRLIDGKGRALRFRIETYGRERGRLIINGEPPKWVDGRTVGFYGILGRNIDPIPRITVNPSREAGEIAQDIKQRLLPNYLKLFDQAKESVDQKRSELNWCDNITNLLKRLLDARFPHNDPRRAKYETSRWLYFGKYDNGKGSGEVHFSTYRNGQIDIKIDNLSTDNAIKLISLYSSEILKNEPDPKRR